MAAYNYLLYRIYMFYKDSKYETGNYLFSTSLVSTVLISINLMTLYFFFDYKNLVPTIPNKFYVVIFMVFIWTINYYGFVKNGEFLNYNFKKDKKGGFIVISFIILTAVSSIFIANLNRNKLLVQ